MKRPKDERITAQVNKVGNEAFFLVMGICVVTTLVRQFILDQRPGTESYLLLGGTIFYTVRCFQLEAFELPANFGKSKRYLSRSVLILALISLGFGLSYSVRNCILYQNGNYTAVSLISGVILASSFFVLLVIAFAIYLSVSSRLSKRYED